MTADVAALFLTSLISPPFIMIRLHLHTEAGIIFLDRCAGQKKLA